MEAADLVSRLMEALRAEDAAAEAARRARAAQAGLLCALRKLGVPTTRAVHRLASLGQLALPIGERLRLAERLRKRARRGTGRPGFPLGAHGVAEATSLPSSERAPLPDTEENTMGKLFKRTTITEEWVQPKMADEEDLEAAADEESGEDDLDEELDEETDEDDEEAPPKRAAKPTRK